MCTIPSIQSTDAESASELPVQRSVCNYLGRSISYIVMGVRVGLIEPLRWLIHVIVEPIFEALTGEDYISSTSLLRNEEIDTYTQRFNAQARRVQILTAGTQFSSVNTPHDRREDLQWAVEQAFGSEQPYDFQGKQVLIPLLVHGSHWISLLVDTDRKEISVLNSTGLLDEETATLVLDRMVQAKELFDMLDATLEHSYSLLDARGNEIPLYSPEPLSNAILLSRIRSHQQQDSWHCGTFVAQYGDYLERGFSVDQINQRDFPRLYRDIFATRRAIRAANQRD